MLRISKTRWTGIGLVSMFSTSVGFAQPVLYVDANATGANNGLSWCGAFARLQDALAIATAPGGVTEIRIAGGVYRPDRGPNQTPGDRSATFRLVSGVSLLGGFAGCGAADPDARDPALHESILSGDLLGDDGADFANYDENSYHIVTYDDASATGVVLDGFTISGGNANGANPMNQGGAVHIRGGGKCIPGGPTIRNCVIRENRASHHGAINDHGLATVIENCTFRDNFAGEEGAGLLIHSGPTQVTNCQFIDNVVDGEGGGAWASHDDDASCASAASTPTFTGCTFTGNRAISGDGTFRGTGGGLFVELNRPTIADCLFESNEAAANGGGLFVGQATAVIRDSTFRDNSSPGITGHAGAGNGGGVWMGLSQPGQSGASLVLRSTFSGNFAEFYGGGLSLANNTARVEQCTFTTNDAGRGGGIRIAYGEPRIVRSTFDGNLGQNYGGAIVVEGRGARAHVWNSVFRNNNAYFGTGGALFVFDTEATFGNCLFVGNRSHAGGGVLNSGTGNSLFINSTFYGNTTIGPGTLAEFYSFNQQSPGQATFHNCVMWNSPPQFVNYDNSVITVTHSGVWGGWPGTGNFATDPRFVDADGADNVIGTTDDDLRLCSTSPGIDAADDAAVPADVADVDGDGNTAETVAIDLSGAARMLGGQVDLGVYEGYFSGGACDAPFCLYGDVNASGVVNFLDIAAIVQVFKGLPTPVTFDDADIIPCGGDGQVNFQDVSADVAAFKGVPPCAGVCNGSP